jgi:hypothetical protein
MATDHSPGATALRGSFTLKAHVARAIVALLAAGALLPLTACGTGAPAQRPYSNWEPGCTGPPSFCVPFFGP